MAVTTDSQIERAEIEVGRLLAFPAANSTAEDFCRFTRQYWDSNQDWLIDYSYAPLLLTRGLPLGLKEVDGKHPTSGWQTTFGIDLSHRHQGEVTWRLDSISREVSIIRRLVTIDDYTEGHVVICEPKGITNKEIAAHALDAMILTTRQMAHQSAISRPNIDQPRLPLQP